MQINKTEFQALITYYMKKRGIRGLNELSESTLISYKTLLKYWKDPEKFPLGEVGRIMDTLEIPSEEFLNKIFMRKGGGIKNEVEEELITSNNRRNHGSSRGSSNRSDKPLVNLADIQAADIPRLRNQLW